MDIANKIKLPIALGLAAFVGVAGASIITGLQANAATTTDTSTTTQTAAKDESVGGHTGTNGTVETLLTGDTAEKVKAAALAEVSGGTILRVETDAEGAAYEAHVQKSDGTQVTVKLDSSFKVTSTESGHGNRQ